MEKQQPARSGLVETPDRMEPARLETLPAAIADAIAELAVASATLGASLHPETAANLADLVRIMNTYYSNLIEGHNTRPQDIARAMQGRFDDDRERRNLQIEAIAHAKVQRQIDRMAADGCLPEPASADFIRWLHREFYRDQPPEMLHIQGAGRDFTMVPGDWRSLPYQDVAVGRHQPPSSNRVAAFMEHFETRYRLADLGLAGRVAALAAAHHRFNFIHPFPDGNGRVSRLMSHAMALKSGIGAHGLWSVSRGLARGLDSRSEYRRMMDLADSPRQGDLDGRGNLSQRALSEFVLWFVRICLDQVRFMSGLFDLQALSHRLSSAVRQQDNLKPEAARLLEETLMRGKIDRGDAARITGLPERSARRVVNDVVAAGLLASETPKGALSLRFPADMLDALFPRLFLET